MPHWGYRPPRGLTVRLAFLAGLCPHFPMQGLTPTVPVWFLFLARLGSPSLDSPLSQECQAHTHPTRSLPFPGLRWTCPSGIFSGCPAMAQHPVLSSALASAHFPATTSLLAFASHLSWWPCENRDLILLNSGPISWLCLILTTITECCGQ